MDLVTLLVLLADLAAPPKPIDGASLARMKAAIAALVILGVAMILLTWLGARITRRYRHGTSFHVPTPRPTTSDWTPQPLSAKDKFDDETPT